MQRLYAEDEFYTSGDATLLDHYRFFKEHKEFEETEPYRNNYKNFCDAVRRAIGISKVIGFMLDNATEEVLIFTFPIEATLSNYYRTEYDPEVGVLYIDVA